jgi:hypothetical protein
MTLATLEKSIVVSSPRELSSLALESIRKDPGAHSQRTWHLWSDPYGYCSTTHCYGGWIDIHIGIPSDYRRMSLYNDVEKIMGLSRSEWLSLTYVGNTLEVLEYYHNLYFEKNN